MDYLKLSLKQISNLLKSGEITSRELLEKCFEQIEKTKDINALNFVLKEKALKKADRTDALRKEGKELSVLAGVPIIIKDNINLQGELTTCSSNILKNYESVYSATVVKKLQEEGAIIIGKANMDEFAMGSSNENSAFGNVKNPLDKTRVPGGSSGGSVASVASYQCFASLGTDTGGSIRQPASFCGVVGLKPTYGLVSRFGVTAFGSSLDQVGPITRTVEDSAIMLEAISGHDAKESTSSLSGAKQYSKLIKNSVKGIRIGVAKEYFELPMDNETRQSVEKAIQFYKQNGCKIVNISLPNIKYALPVYYVLSSAEAASNLGRFDGVRYGLRAKSSGLEDMYVKTKSQGFGTEVKRRIMLGNFVLSSGYFDAYYNKAKKVRSVLKQEFNKAFEKCDVIISPTVGGTAFKIGEKIDDHIEMYMNDIFTVPSSIVGVPAISIPCGVAKNNMPLGLQLIAPHFKEETLFTVANYLEKNFNKGGNN